MVVTFRDPSASSKNPEANGESYKRPGQPRRERNAIMPMETDQSGGAAKRCFSFSQVKRSAGGLQDRDRLRLVVRGRRDRRGRTKRAGLGVFATESSERGRPRRDQRVSDLRQAFSLSPGGGLMERPTKAGAWPVASLIMR